MDYEGFSAIRESRLGDEGRPPQRGAAFIVNKVEAIGRYSNPVHPEKSLEELETLNRDLVAQAKDRPVPQPARRRTRRTPELERQLVARYQSGAATAALCTEFQIGKDTVLSILDAHGVTRKRTLPSDRTMAKAEGLYTSGLSLKALELRLGVPASTLQLQFKKRGVALRPRGGSKPQA